MIEPISEKNINDILPLIRQYQEFYQVENIDDEKNREFFSQFNKNNDFGCQFIYRDEQGLAVAFATVYFSFSSTIAEKVGVLNDLYTLPNSRGQDIAKQLIKHCYQFSKEKGAARLQWLTANDNTTAQSLYNSLDAKKSSWLFYSFNPKP